MAWQGKAGEVRRDWAWQGKVRHGKAGKVRQGCVGCGMLWHGVENF